MATTKMATRKDGMLLSKISPTFLHANSTSHTWVFSAIAELIDNAYDPDVDASSLYIDKIVLYSNTCLTFTDDGNGMNAERLHQMLSFGYCDKAIVLKPDHKPVGHYGNGFKSGSMRLGKDAIVFTKCDSTLSVGLLSQSFLKSIGADEVLVPIVSWNAASKCPEIVEDTKESLTRITKCEYSLYRTEKELLNEFEAINGPSGTKIIIYNLKSGKDGMFELDFDSKPDDIINPEHQELDSNSENYRPVQNYQPEYKRSLREYSSILFLKPKMKIFLRGKKVKTKYMTKSLNQTEKDKYQPRHLKKPVEITFGFNSSEQDYGMLLYHRNRLIKAYTRLGLQKKNTGEGIGVVGVAEVDFLKPTHIKQDFINDDRYNATMNALAIKLNDYWAVKKPSDAPKPGSSSHVRKPDWTWVQCDQCDKWRRMPEEFDKQLPEKWYCYLNPDTMFNRCDVPEALDNEDELRPTYEKPKRTRQQKKGNRENDSVTSRNEILDASSEDEDITPRKKLKVSGSVKNIKQSRYSSTLDSKTNESESKSFQNGEMILLQSANIKPETTGIDNDETETTDETQNNLETIDNNEKETDATKSILETINVILLQSANIKPETAGIDSDEKETTDETQSNLETIDNNQRETTDETISISETNDNSRKETTGETKREPKTIGNNKKNPDETKCIPEAINTNKKEATDETESNPETIINNKKETDETKRIPKTIGNNEKETTDETKTNPETIDNNQRETTDETKIISEAINSNQKETTVEMKQEIRMLRTTLLSLRLNVLKLLSLIVPTIDENAESPELADELLAETLTANIVIPRT